MFGIAQGGNEVRSRIQMDDICFGGQIVAVHGPDPDAGISFHPIPVENDLIIEFSRQPMGQVVIEVKDLWSRVLKSDAVINDTRQHSMAVSIMPPGMYLLKVKEEGRVIWRDKFVRVGN